MINYQIFCLYLDQTNNSYADIGQIDFKAMRGGSLISSGFVWINIPPIDNNIFWYGRASGIRYGYESSSSVSY